MSVFPAGHILTSADLDTMFPTGIGAWTAYTPTWSGTIGNGTLAGAYAKIGRTVHYHAGVTWGSSSSHAAAAQTVSIPVACAAGIVAYPAGTTRILDLSAGSLFTRQAYLASSTTLAFLTEAGAFVTNLLPMTWATGDTLLVYGTYEAAS